MWTLWLENHALTIRDGVPLPEISLGEACIKINVAGICSTDLELVKGYYPFTGIPGHEFVGVVEDVRGDPKWIGKRVVGDINVSCGDCRSCLRGNPTHCLRRKVLGIKNLNGAFAQYLSLPISNLHLVPDSLADETAVFTEPLAAVLEILEQVKVLPTDRVLVIGAGRLGQLVAQVLVLTGCELAVVTRHNNQRLILENLSITVATEDNLDSRNWDIVVDATGSPEGFKLACQAVRPRGTIVLKSTYAGHMDMNLSLLVVNEITLIGSRCGPFEPALRLLEQGMVDPTKLISARFGLLDGIDAFRQAAKPGILKVLFEMNEY